MNNLYKTPFRVINASAGSGKTFALTRAYLTHLLGVKVKRPFKNQLALTFTNKAVDDMKNRILERLVSFSKGQDVDDQMATYLMSDLKIGPEELERRADRMIRLILKDYGAFQVMTIDKFTNRIVNVFSKDFGLSQNFEIELELEKMADDIIHSIVWEVSQHSDDATTTKFKDFAREMSYREQDWNPIKPLKKLLKEIYNENNKPDIDKFKEINDDQLNEIQNRLYTLRESLRTTVNKAISDSLENLKIESSLVSADREKLIHDNATKGVRENEAKRNAIRDFKKFLEKITNLISRNSEELKPFMYGGSRSNLGKEKIGEFRDKVEIELKRFTLINKILKNWIPFSMLQTLSGRIQKYQHDEQRMLLSELNHKVSEVVKNSPTPFIYERFGEQFRHYYIDEFQDTSVLQWENLIPLIGNSLSSEDVNHQAGSLLIVGDPKQAIYRWRGGKREQLVDLIFKDKELFSGIKQEIEELDTNYRSKDNIVLFNNEFYQYACNLSSDEEFKKTFIRSETSLGAVQRTNHKPGGYVQVELVNTNKPKAINSESHEKEANGIILDDQNYADKIIGLEQQERDVYSDDKVKGKNLFKELTILKTLKAIYQSKNLGYRYRDISILVRSNRESTIISEKLTENEIPFISEGSLKLNNSEDVQFVLNLVHLTVHQNDKAIQKKLLDRLWTAYKKSLTSTSIDYHDFVNRAINRDNFTKKPTYMVLKAVEQWIGRDFQWHIFVHLNLFEAVEYVISSFNFLKLENAAIQSFLEVVYEFSTKGKATFHDFLEFWEARKDKLSFESPSVEDCVTVLTAHKAKGLEFPIVIIPFVVEEFRLNKPGEARTDWVPIDPEEGLDIGVEKAWLSIKKEDFVDYHGGALKTTYERLWSEHLNEEMNILYVATTRASEALFLIVNYDKAKKDVQAIPKLFGKFSEDQIESTDLQFNLIEREQVGTTGFSIGEFRHHSKSDVSEQDKSKKNIDVVDVTSSYSWLNRIIKRVNVKSDPFIQRGSKTHTILEKLITYQDVDTITEKYVRLFWNDEQLKERIRDIMIKIVNHPEISICYRQPSESIYCEKGLLAPSRSPEEETIRLVPDRVVVLQDKVIVLDYKTGKLDGKHYVQLEKYVSVVKEIHEKPVEAFLVYIDISEQAISVKKIN